MCEQTAWRASVPIAGLPVGDGSTTLWCGVTRCACARVCAVVEQARVAAGVSTQTCAPGLTLSTQCFGLPSWKRGWYAGFDVAQTSCLNATRTGFTPEFTSGLATVGYLLDDFSYVLFTAALTLLVLACASALCGCGERQRRKRRLEDEERTIIEAQQASERARRPAPVAVATAWVIESDGEPLFTVQGNVTSEVDGPGGRNRLPTVNGLAVERAKEVKLTGDAPYAVALV